MLNNDFVATPPALSAWFEELNLLAIQEQDRLKRGKERSFEKLRTETRVQLQSAGPQQHSQSAALGGQFEWLREAGFKSIDCYLKHPYLSIVGGAKE